MRKTAEKRLRILAAALLALLLAACSIVEDDPIVFDGPREGRIVNLYSPMEKSSPDAENVARTAADLTVAMAEEELGVSVAYRTYTAEDHQDKTYDDVAIDRIRSNMDDIYLLNPDVIQTMGT